MDASTLERASLQAELNSLRERVRQLESLLAVPQEQTSARGEPLRTEDESQPSAEFARLASDVNPAVLYIFDLTEQRTLYANREVANLVGYSPEQIRDLGCTILPALLHPEDQVRVRAHLELVRKLRDHETADFECRVRHADGRWRWLVNRNAVFRRDSSGTAIQMIGASLDITERKQVEEALRESEKRLASIAANMPGAVYRALLHTDGRISCLYVSPGVKALFGFESEEVIADAGLIVRAVHPEDRKRFFAAARAALQELQPFDHEYRVLTRSGELHWHRDIGQPHRLANGDVVLDGLAVDVTEGRRSEEKRRHLEARIQHAQKLESLSVLAGGIAHDFNNLLTGMLGHASMALRDLPPQSPARFAVQQIETTALRAAELTQQMLAYSGKGRFLIQPLDLSHIVEEMAGLLQTVISKKAVLRFDLSTDLPAVEADATQIRQVVMNLITNASDALGEENGILVLRTGVMYATHEYLAAAYVAEDLPSGDYVYVEVADTGCGMSGETMQRIFDPFFTTKFTGRGLGLAAVLGIVRGHRGTIKVSSEPGQGTSFKVFLPCVQCSTIPPQPYLPAPETWCGSGTLLVMDDEESVRAIIQRALKAAGFQVLLASDGRAGLEVFRRHRAEISAVLLDLNMPQLSGEEVFQELRRLCPEVRVVLMSGYNQQEVSTLFAGKGLAGFVQKPFRVDDLLGTVQRTLEAGQ